MQNVIHARYKRSPRDPFNWVYSPEKAREERGKSRHQRDAVCVYHPPETEPTVIELASVGEIEYEPNLNTLQRVSNQDEDQTGGAA